MIVKTQPLKGQKPGTSGLRKTVKVFQAPHYLENYVQSIFDCASELIGGTIVLGGDGRFFNKQAIQTIIQMACANGVKKVIVGQNGLLSTPAVSCIIRKYKAQGGIILSASHNPGGPEGDFGLKYNVASGGSAPESLTDAIYKRTQNITDYKIAKSQTVPLGEIGTSQIEQMQLEVIDPVSDYAELMESLFDFPAISNMIKNGFTLCFDAMHAITGPYATTILEDRLGAAKGSVINHIPLPDFGGGHPDPNPVYAKSLFDLMFSDDAPDFGAASDGDGDRNIILGKSIYVSPSDSVAVIAANAHYAPAYADGIVGVARSMPTSCALDRVAARLNIPCHVTPTGWKFFGNLLDAGQITICGEESAGTSSDHIREKDGLWAVLLWLNILAMRGETVGTVLEQHWQTYGRNYYSRHDYEAIDLHKAKAVMAHLEAKLPELAGKTLGTQTVSKAQNMTYLDPVDGSTSANQGLMVEFKSGSRIVLRLSGTGTVGGTLRVYIERYTDQADQFSLPVQEALNELIEISKILIPIKEMTGRAEPTVIS